MISTSRASFPLTDLESLPQIVAFDISLQLLSCFEEVLRQAVTDERLRPQVFADELEETVIVAQAGVLR